MESKRGQYPVKPNIELTLQSIRRKVFKVRVIFLQDGGVFSMIFGAFSKMISSMPVQAVLKTLDLECKMLEDDLEHHCLTGDEDTFSILCFSQFVQKVKAGEVMRRLKSLPFDHLEFYRETVVRLVNANQLPSSAMEQFERAFPLIL